MNELKHTAGRSWGIGVRTVVLAGVDAILPKPPDLQVQKMPSRGRATHRKEKTRLPINRGKGQSGFTYRDGVESVAPINPLHGSAVFRGIPLVPQQPLHSFLRNNLIMPVNAGWCVFVLRYD